MANKIKNNLDMVSGSKYNLLKQIPFHRKIGNIFFSKNCEDFVELQN